MSQQTLNPTKYTQPIPIDPDTLLTEHQTTRMLNVSSRTLQNWRLRGGGPLYVKCGRAIRYRRRDLLDWIEKGTIENTGQSVER